MEENIFPLPEVSAELNKTVEARLHLDSTKSPFFARMEELQRDYTGTKSVPVYLVIDPETETVIGRRNGASFKEKVFLDFFRGALAGN